MESDGKGFRQPRPGSVGALFVCPDAASEKGGTTMKKSGKKTVIAYRKSCKAMGTGLSHYILMDRKAK